MDLTIAKRICCFSALKWPILARLAYCLSIRRKQGITVVGGSHMSDYVSNQKVHPDSTTSEWVSGGQMHRVFEAKKEIPADRLRFL